MPENTHRPLDIETIASTALHELARTREFFQIARGATRDRELVRACALCERIHVELLHDLRRAGLVAEQLPAPTPAPDERELAAALDGLRAGDASRAGPVVRAHIARTLELLECLFADFPSMAVRRTIKLHFRNVQRSHEIARRLTLRQHAA